MAENPIKAPLPADLPEDWTYGQTVAPTGEEAGLSTQHGYNYLMQQVNAAQRGVNEVGKAFSGLPSLGPDGKIPVEQLPAMNYDPAGSAAGVQKNLDAHTGDRQNPHGVTAVQTGAIPATQKGTAGGVATLDSGGRVPPGQLPSMNYDPAGSAAGVQKNLDAHTGDTTIHVTAQEKATWSGKASIAVVSYIGTGGDSVTINFPFVPSFVIIGPQQDKNENQPSGFNPLEQNYGDRRASIIPYGVDQSYDGRGSIYSLSWSGASLTITKSNNYYTLPCKFYCFAFA